jgi:cell division protein FtsB
MRVVVICLIIILFGLQYKLWLGDDSLLHWMQLDRKLKAQTEENAKLLARNRAIEMDIMELKSGKQSLEEHARYDLGMIKQDETYYQFVD